MNAIAKLRKALTALIIAGGGALVASLGVDSPGGEAVTASEWWATLGFSLAAAGGVFLVPNAPTSSQRARIIADHQAARFRNSSGSTGPY